MKKSDRKGSSKNKMPACVCECDETKHETSLGKTKRTSKVKKVLNVDLLVIDLETCERCVPTADQLQTAVRLLQPAAHELGITLRYREVVVKSPEEARSNALLSSPTIRLNGRDIAGDIRESECGSCGDLTENGTVVDCREWHYRGNVYYSAPLPLLIEVIMEAMLRIDDLPAVTPRPLEELPKNLEQFFRASKPTREKPSCCC